MGKVAAVALASAMVLMALMPLGDGASADQWTDEFAYASTAEMAAAGWYLSQPSSTQLSSGVVTLDGTLQTVTISYSDIAPGIDDWRAEARGKWAGGSTGTVGVGVTTEQHAFLFWADGPSGTFILAMDGNNVMQFGSIQLIQDQWVEVGLQKTGNNLTMYCNGAYLNGMSSSSAGHLVRIFTTSPSMGKSAYDRISLNTAPVTQWRATSGGGASDFGYSAAMTSDGGLAVLGVTQSYGAGGMDSFLVRLDKDGHELWNRTYGGTSADYTYGIRGTNDGGFMLAGAKWNTTISNFRAWLVKVDQNGVQQWSREYGSSSRDVAFTVVQTADGGFAFTGYTTVMNQTANGNMWLVKTDASGTQQWEVNFGGSLDDWGKSLVQTSDGGYAIAGWTRSFGGACKAYLIRTDSTGSLKWGGTYGGDGTTYGYGLAEAADGGILIGGHSNTTGQGGQGGYDFYAARTSSVGSFLWEKRYGGPGDDLGTSTLAAGDGFLMGGTSNSYDGGLNTILVMRLDGNGSMVWSGAYGMGTNASGSVALVAGSDGDVLVGNTPTSGPGREDMLVIRLRNAVTSEFTYTTSGVPAVATITGYNGHGGAVTIPSVIDGFNVVAIGNNAFNSAAGHLVTSIVIPSGVVTIGNYSFRQCRLLTSVTMPNTIATIGAEAFFQCTALTSIAIPNGLSSIGTVAFMECSSLTAVTIPGSVSSIGGGAFAGCGKLSNIWVDASNPNYASVNGILYDKAMTILVQYPAAKAGPFTAPGTVVTIGTGAFYNCTGLTQAFLPNSVDTIEVGAFFNCTSLTEVTIGGGLATIQDRAFDNCTSLGSMSFLGQATPSSVGAGWIRNTPSALRGHASAASGFPTPGNTFNGLIMGSNINPIISDYEYTVSGGSATITGYKGAGGAISIPSMLGGYPTIALGQYCFDSVLGHGITSAIIPNTVTTIGTQAFLSCSALTSVTIPQSVTRIESLAFSYCTSLSNATIPNGVAFFDTYTFSHDNALVSVVIGSGVTSIGDMALAYCPALTSITFLGLTAPTSVTSNWIEGNSAALRGHADAASNFPAAGASFYGLVMGGTIYQLPSAPLGLNGVAGNAQVVLSWLAPANEGSSPVTGYNLYRASAAGGPFALLAATASPGYTDVGLSNGQSYWYEVSALNSLGEGNLTPAMAAIPFTSPSVPTGLAASPGDGQITLRWTAPSDGGSAIDYYIVYQNGTELTVHPTGTSVTIQNLANGCNYSFAVAAHNAAGGGAQSLAVISSPAESGNEIGEVLSPAAAIIVGTGIAAIGVGLAGGSASASGSGVGDFADKMKGRFASLDKFFDFLYGFVKGRLTSMAFKLLNKVEPEKGVAVKREAFLAGFSAHEMVVIVFTSAVLGLTYLIANGMVVLDLGNILIYFVVAGFAIIVHDLTHRYMAWRYHAVSEYQFWWLGTAIMFLTAGLFHVVYAMPARLRIDASTKLTVRQEAFVYGSGPLVSFIVFLAFALLIPLGGLAETIALLGCSMNLLTAVYSMMPFKPMDGKFVMKWSIWAWVLTFPPLLALYFALTIYVF